MKALTRRSEGSPPSLASRAPMVFCLGFGPRATAFRVCGVQTSGLTWDCCDISRRYLPSLYLYL